MTRKEIILSIIKPGIQISCGDLCKIIINTQNLTGNKARYLSGSISSILNKMVKDKILMYSPIKGPKGGYTYELNKKL